MSDPSLNLANLVTVENIYTNAQCNMTSECVTAYNAVRTELFALLTDVSYVCNSPINTVFTITNVATDASGGLIDSPYITCVYNWVDGVMDVKPQRILQVICADLKKLKLKAFFTTSASEFKQTLTVYYPSSMDKNFITS